MIERVIEGSVRNRGLVLLLTAGLVALGMVSLRGLPFDAIPDLSDVQVMVLTNYDGQSPDVVEDQVTYPLTTTMLGVPRAKAVRGYSYFGLSMVYVIFDEGTDLYWARSRVLESLSFAGSRLPPGVTPEIGPDATGVGWVFQYVLLDFGPFARVLRQRLTSTPVAPLERQEVRALFEGAEFDADEAVEFTFDDFDDDRDNHLSPEELQTAIDFNGVDVAQLRSLQDWFLRYELAAVPGVAEVASVGGFVRQYQVEVDPDRLNAFGIPLSSVRDAIQRSNKDVGGRTIEWAETEFMVRGRGYLKSVEDLRRVPVAVDEDHVPVLLRDVANVQLGPELRRGIVDWNGWGDTAAGIVVMRQGQNALEVIERVKKRLAELDPSLGRGVNVVTAYDRSKLIYRAIDNLQRKLTEEMAIVAVVCAVFLFHLRSALVAIVSIPVGLLMSLALMRLLGVNADIMSLGGLAIAVGVMVDASVVMVENVHKHLERDELESHGELVVRACKEVGPALFYSLLIVTISFLPVFGLQAQEGRLFSPLAYAKTFAMALSSLLAITLVPVLIYYFLRGRVRGEESDPLARLFKQAYLPVIRWSLLHPKRVVVLAIGFLLLTGVPASRLGSEFMPPLDEGDLLYMPTTLPGISITKARELLQQTNRMIRQFPEVKSVFGKIGRADSATDPAPLSMIETTIVLEPDRRKWRTRATPRWYSGWAPEWLAGLLSPIWPDTAPISTTQLVSELNASVRLPGVTNAWTMPIKTRIDMLATGIKTPVGVKIMGTDLEQLSALGQRIEEVLKTVPGTLSVYAERATGGNYLDFVIDRDEAARYGLNVGDIQDVIQSAIGGMNITTTVEGLERYPVNLRYKRELRDDIDALERILVPTKMGHNVPLGQLARMEIKKGPPAIKSENARRTAWVYVDLEDIDVGTYVTRAQESVRKEIQAPRRGFDRLVGSVRIHGAGAAEVDDPHSLNALGDLPAAVSALSEPEAERDRADVPSFRGGRGHLADVWPGVLFERSNLRRVHCARRAGRRDLGGHARIPSRVPSSMACRRTASNRSGSRRGHHRGFGRKSPAEAYDGGDHPHRTDAGDAERRDGGGDHAAHCRPDGRGSHLEHAGHAGDRAGGLSPPRSAVGPTELISSGRTRLALARVSARFTHRNKKFIRP